MLSGLHYVRDFTYDEDRCRAHVGHVPERLATISNVAISLIRLHRFEYVPPVGAGTSLPGPWRRRLQTHSSRIAP